MPTFAHGKNAKVLVAEHDLTTSFKEFTATASVDMAETSAFGNTNKTFVQGLADTGISLTGMWAGGADEVDDVLGSLLSSTATIPVTICPNGYAIGRTGFGLGSQQSSYEITGSIGDVVAVSSQFQAKVDTGGRSGKQLAAGTSITSTSNLTSVDGTAATTGGGYALLHVPTNTHDGETTITIEDSADDSTFATIGTFTAVAATTETSEYLAITGNIRRYVRAVVTLAGSTGGISPHILLVRL